MKCWHFLTWGGLTNDDVSKKGNLLQLQQMHKQEHSTFDFEIEFFL